MCTVKWNFSCLRNAAVPKASEAALAPASRTTAEVVCPHLVTCLQLTAGPGLGQLKLSVQRDAQVSHVTSHGSSQETRAVLELRGPRA